GAHRAFGVLAPFVRAVSVDLVPLQLSPLKRGSAADGFAGLVHFVSDSLSFHLWVSEQLGHHVDDVLKGVVIVVPENDVVPRLALGGLAARLLCWPDALLRFGD